MKEPTSYLLYELLKLNTIKVDKKELEFQFESHPSYPSLHSITGVLNHFGIDNLAVEVPNNEETLKELPESFIAHLKDEQGEHFVLTKIKNGQIEIVLDKKKKKILTKDAFLQSWTGIIVAVEKTEDFNENKGKQFSEKLFYWVGALSILLIFFQNDITWFKAIHYFTSIIGVVVSVLIVQHELGLNSAVLDKFCSGNSEKTSCDDVLKSEGATIIGNLKFSDIGLIYFSAVLLSWLILSFTENANANILVIVSLLAIPFTFYSLYYQYFIVKKWCPLCLSVLAVLWAQALSALLYGTFDGIYMLHIKSTVAIAFSFVSVSLVWMFLHPKLELEIEHRKLKIEHNRFKNNYSIFEALISRNPKIDSDLPNASEIVLGNKSKNHLLKIVLITNPLCGHCKDAHQAIEPLIKSKNTKLQVIIRFNVNASDQNSVDTKIAAKLLAIYHNKGEQEVILALNDAYSEMGASTWLKKWEIEVEENYFLELLKEKEWCSANNINFTPEILINGRAFPKEYNRTDLKYFIDDLIEEELQEKKALVHELELES